MPQRVTHVAQSASHRQDEDDYPVEVRGPSVQSNRNGKPQAQCMLMPIPSPGEARKGVGRHNQPPTVVKSIYQHPQNLQKTYAEPPNQLPSTGPPYYSRATCNDNDGYQERSISSKLSQVPRYIDLMNLIILAN